MLTGIKPDHLKQTLAALPPVDLLGLELLRQFQAQSGAWFPSDIDTELVAEATSELIDYIQGCKAACARLEELPPVPLTALSVVEFGL